MNSSSRIGGDSGDPRQFSECRANEEEEHSDSEFDGVRMDDTSLIPMKEIDEFDSPASFRFAMLLIARRRRA